MANKSAVNKVFLQELRKEYQYSTVSRRKIIQSTSEILTLAKKVIFAGHRNEIKEARANLLSAQNLINKLADDVQIKNKLLFEGSLRAALEEYLEAALFIQYLEKGIVTSVPKLKIPVDHELYIGALSDLTGELARRAIALATKREMAGVVLIKEVIEEIVGEFIQFDLLSNLRSKFDQAKKNLRTVEEILYELSLRN